MFLIDLYIKTFVKLSRWKFKVVNNKKTMKYNFQYRNDQRIFVIGDSHWHHFNILKLCNRPFEDLKQMNEEMVKRWNKIVSPNDIVIHLGDFSMSRNPNYIQNILSQLNGKIILVWGNHDNRKAWNKVLELQENKDKVILTTDVLECKIPYNHDYVDIVFCHYPIAQWNHKHHGSLHFYGHCHGTYVNGGKSVDIGVDSLRNVDSDKDFAPTEISKIVTAVLRENQE